MFTLVDVLERRKSDRGVKLAGEGDLEIPRDVE